MKLWNGSLIGLAFLAMAGLAGAHLTDGSLMLIGSDMLQVGQPVSIKWNVGTDHIGGSDIAFSKDGGTTWTTIKQGFVDAKDNNTFNWSGPDAVTSNGKIRICQTAGTACTDANNVSLPSGKNNSGPYVLVTAAFMVMPSTNIIGSSTENGAISLNFRSDSRNVEVAFTNSQMEKVSLQAFDTQGRLIANLIDGNYAAGKHQLSVFSNRLERNAQALVFKIKVGNEVKTQSWNGF